MEVCASSTSSKTTESMGNAARSGQIVGKTDISAMWRWGNSALFISRIPKHDDSEAYRCFIHDKNLSELTFGASYQLTKRLVSIPGIGHLQGYFMSQQVPDEVMKSALRTDETSKNLDSMSLQLHPAFHTAVDSNMYTITVTYCQCTDSAMPVVLLDILQQHNISSYDQYVGQSPNGISTMVTAFMREWCPPGPLCAAQLLSLISHGLSMSHCVPGLVFCEHIRTGRLSPQETAYAHCAWRFACHFLHHRKGGYVCSEARQTSTNKLRTIIYRYPQAIRALSLQFARAHYCGPGLPEDILRKGRGQLTDGLMQADKMDSFLRQAAASDFENLVLSFFITFSNAVLATNFFWDTKAAVSFRLYPDFLDPKDCPDPLYGMFFVCGPYFCGIHLRMCEVAHGGIRLVLSRTEESFQRNCKRLFAQSYRLTETQNRKNRGIPEGGAQGVILLDLGHNDKAETSFKAFITSILDLKPECLFMGPDENTASYVDWATEYARDREVPWWRLFFTGKSPRLGGIPHDTHGMTTLSVRQYFEGTHGEIGPAAVSVRKMQTGCPDGDLGSNEILRSLQRDGGVISSSFEVLAALLFTEEEFARNMCVREDGSEPLFHRTYVEQVKEMIRNRVGLEFKAIRNAHKRTGKTHSVIADDLNRRIMELRETIKDSPVWSEKFQRSVLEQAVPSVLLEKVPHIMDRFKRVGGDYMLKFLISS